MKVTSVILCNSVCHILLLVKLKSFSGKLSWFENYLTNRLQHVIDGEQSEQSGVPQGSIMGPFLFLLYINDKPKCIKIPNEIAFYADDANMYTQIQNNTYAMILNFMKIQTTFLTGAKNGS